MFGVIHSDCENTVATEQYIKNDVMTLCVGQAASVAASFYHVVRYRYGKETASHEPGHRAGDGHVSVCPKCRGRSGGLNAAQTMTQKQRQERARKAIAARWGKRNP